MEEIFVNFANLFKSRENKFPRNSRERGINPGQNKSTIFNFDGGLNLFFIELEPL